MARRGSDDESTGTEPDERDEPEALWGFRVVADAGTQLPTPCGTEEANEGDASAAGNKWAKRKFKAGPIDSVAGPGKY
jgi:hypothetical protein